MQSKNNSNKFMQKAIAQCRSFIRDGQMRIVHSEVNLEPIISAEALFKMAYKNSPNNPEILFMIFSCQFLRENDKSAYDTLKELENLGDKILDELEMKYSKRVKRIQKIHEQYKKNLITGEKFYERTLKHILPVWKSILKSVDYL